jgi:tetratricopeptide (TPR) repeat protein
VLPEAEVNAECTKRFTAAVPRILPPDIADFTGRVEEVALLREWLANSPRQSVVAVAGRGGVGKTALSIHTAHSLRLEFPDGQLYVNLRGVDDRDPADPFEVLGRFLRALGVAGAAVPESFEERVDLYRDLLAERRVIVVLDNASSDEQVLLLIPGGSACATIINSRARLGAALGARVLTLDVLDSAESSQLLSRIAGGERVAAEPDAVGDLCAYCGHLPLAVRIAAAKLAAKPHWKIAKLTAMLRGERERLDHLAHGHLDVRASMVLGYSALRPAAQRLLRSLGDLELPEVNVWISAALLDVNPDVAEDILEQLFDGQFLDISGQDATGHARYRMHDLVRLFARERAQSDEPSTQRESTRTRALGAWLFIADAAHHAVYGGNYRNIAGDAPRWTFDEELAGQLVAEPLQWFETERQSIVAAVNLAARLEHSDACWQLACTTSPLFEMGRYFDDLLGMLGTALSAVRQSGDRRGQAALLYRMGRARTDRAQDEQALDHFREAVQLFEQLGDHHGQATVISCLAMMERFRGADDAALALYEQALPPLRQAADHGGEAAVLRAIGQIFLQRGSYVDAEAYFASALDVCRSSGSRRGEAQVRFWWGMLHLEQGEDQGARAEFERALSICRTIGDVPGQANSLRGLGLYYRHVGDVERARATLMEALRIVRQPRATYLESHILQCLKELDEPA